MNPDPFADPDWLDPKAVERLHIVLQDKFASMVETAITNIRSHSEWIAVAVNNRDYPAAQNNAHSIVSSAGVFGMLQLVAVARRMEYASVEASCDEWHALYSEFQDTLRASLNILSSLHTGDRS